MEFVPAAEEAQLRLRTEEELALQEFLGRWDMEDMPACPAGMALLFDFATAHPAAYELARQRDFIEPPMLGNNPRWQAFAAHVRTCPDCNESGTGWDL